MVIFHDTSCLKISISQGADVTSVDRQGKTALHLANSRLRMIHNDQALKSVPERAKKEISQVCYCNDIVATSCNLYACRLLK